jgi:hypothetical protein
MASKVLLKRYQSRIRRAKTVIARNERKIKKLTAKK